RSAERRCRATPDSVSPTAHQQFRAVPRLRALPRTASAASGAPTGQFRSQLGARWAQEIRAARCLRAGRGSRSSSAAAREGHRNDARCPTLLHASQLTRLDGVDEDVPLVLLQDDGVLVLADADRVALDDDL